MSRIPATVVTGFLGSGKTTLIRHILEHADGRRIALVINEFGDLGVDGELIRGCGDALCREEDMIELSNGCICCTVADDFLPAMERLLDRPDPPDHIVIETSGLALPQPLLRAFAWPGVAGRVTVDGVVTVVDGAALAEGRFAGDEDAVASARAGLEGADHDSPLRELFEDQLACADLVVLNKADLLEPEAAEALAASLRAGARPGVRALPARHGALPLGVLLGLGVGAEAEDRRAPHHDGEDDHDHDEFESFVVDLPGEEADPAALAARVRAAVAAHGILRLKGFAAVAGKPLRLAVQAAGPRVETRFDRPWGDAPRRTRLVVIGEAGLDRPAIEAALAP
ncbi:cobalamin biosynthesis protein CobW [Rubellimicrobium sp. CFH 75288]|uniref:cobalamin biosynthesis protein CobW n=1 Tax=Rubellimicrobium sp. CFH 75288 TaxID=2697034 RepID=UPI001412AAC6|nr:cobalamin biosynthesis protein CobW [Rubellimicrobium sp. CFH 75288]NAZ37620.1 cobalamin biosynthesis protein CobW [Rubellimicrobium sp. CFH 75288]